MFSVMNKDCLEAIEKKYIEYWSREDLEGFDFVGAQDYLNQRGYTADFFETRKQVNSVAKQYWNFIIKRTLKRCIQFKSNKQMVKIYLRALLNENNLSGLADIFKDQVVSMRQSFIEKTCEIVEEEMV